MRDRKRERLTDMEKERLTGRLRKTDTEPENERRYPTGIDVPNPESGVAASRDDGGLVNVHASNG